MSGWIPIARNSFTLCCVGLVFSSCAAAIQGTSVTCTNAVLSRPISCRNCRMASRNGSDSMSPTVPPISTITTSTSAATLRAAALISLVTCGNHLHRFAQIIAAPLAMDDLLVDPAGGEIIALRQLGVREALVVAQIEIGLGAIVGDENFAVLERAHGARIDVQVRIELLQRHPQPAAFEQTPDGRRRNAFSER